MEKAIENQENQIAMLTDAMKLLTELVSKLSDLIEDPKDHVVDNKPLIVKLIDGEYFCVCPICDNNMFANKTADAVVCVNCKHSESAADRRLEIVEEGDEESK